MSVTATSAGWLSMANRLAKFWPLLKVFWQENGFDIKSEEPAIGQNGNRVGLKTEPKSLKTACAVMLDKVGLGGIYSTSERDKFIIRIEQGKNGSTDIFFAHKGMKEVYADRKKTLRCGSRVKTTLTSKPHSSPALCNIWALTVSKPNKL